MVVREGGVNSKRKMLELREARRCYPEPVVGVNVGLACVDGVIAFLAFYQLMRIHSRNSQLGWTRQKVFHLMIGSCNLGYFVYFVLTLIAACKGWICWSHSCGFIVMAFPKILFLAAFLLLLSFWVDLCHQSNDDDEDEGCSPREALLEKMDKTEFNTSSCRICCTFWSNRIGSRQKIVILVTVLVFAIMIASSVLIWVGMGKSPISSEVVAQGRCKRGKLEPSLGKISSSGLSSFMKQLIEPKILVSSWKSSSTGSLENLSSQARARARIEAHLQLSFSK